MACVGEAAQNPSALGSKQEFTHVKALLNAVPKRDLCHRQATASKARIVITWRSAQDQQAAKAHRRQKQGRDNHHTTAA
jgi:hypothetical protein